MRVPYERELHVLRPIEQDEEAPNVNARTGSPRLNLSERLCEMMRSRQERLIKEGQVDNEGTRGKPTGEFTREVSVGERLARNVGSGCSGKTFT